MATYIPFRLAFFSTSVSDCRKTIHFIVLCLAMMTLSRREARVDFYVGLPTPGNDLLTLLFFLFSFTGAIADLNAIVSLDLEQL